MFTSNHKLPFETEELQEFLMGKSDISLQLLDFFVDQYRKMDTLTLRPTKSMIVLANSKKNLAYITQIGKNFIHVVFPFEQPYPDNLCFQKIAQVPNDDKQFNHHFRMYLKEDLNDEIKKFMQLGLKEGN